MSARRPFRAWLPGAVLAVVSSLSASIGAQDEAEDADARAERLLKLVEMQTAAAEAAAPSVFEGVDLRRAPAEVRKAVQVLRGTRVDLLLEKQTVDEALEILHGVSGIPFIVSARARQALAQEKPEVTLSLRDLPLMNCINLLALQLGEYRFVVRYGAVMLIRSEEYKPRKALVIYEVSDIVRPRPDFPAPQLGLGEKER
jgi:hypothetical protein